MDKKTAFYECHVKNGGKMVHFAGYLLPVQYTDIVGEHNAVRNRVGVFDVSHMGEVIFEGKDALNNINHILTNDFSNMPDGKVRYSLMCDEDGGVIDDLLVYKFGREKYMVVVNASNRHKDVDWMRDHIFGDVGFKDISDDISQLALQGPYAEKVLSKLTESKDIPKGYYTFSEKMPVAGVPCLVSRTGYTGEDGFEFYFENRYAEKLWNAILDAGKEFDLALCGLGARDTLRLEAAMPLYGHEMDSSITPFETGLGFGVKMNKENFIGKGSLLKSFNNPTRVRIGLEVIGRGILREHQEITVNGKVVGFTTSGTLCPYIKKPVAMAILEAPYADLGNQVTVNVRGKDVLAKIVKLPFYSR